MCSVYPYFKTNFYLKVNFGAQIWNLRFVVCFTQLIAQIHWYILLFVLISTYARHFLTIFSMLHFNFI